MEFELDPAQAIYNNGCTALKWVCHCINWNNNTTITHYSIQKQRKTAKELFMVLFKCQCKHTSLFSHLLLDYINNKSQCASPYISKYALIPFMMFYDVNPQLVNKSCCTGEPKQTITKSHMPMFITNTKLQYKPNHFSIAHYL